jgi:hypothetical protein
MPTWRCQFPCTEYLWAGWRYAILAQVNGRHIRRSNLELPTGGHFVARTPLRIHDFVRN